MIRSQMRKEAVAILRDKMGESGLDSLLVNNQINIRYLTGFTGDFGYLSITPAEIYLFTSKIYEEHAGSTVQKPCRVETVKNNFFDHFSQSGASFRGKKIGFESESLTFSAFNRLKEKLPDSELIPATGMVEELRAVKEPSEIQSISHAQEITDKVFDYVLGLLRDGIEERELANEIDYRFRESGGERSAFETIVASGPNTSKPHAIPTRRKLRAGDLVLFDMGTVIDGYASDMTRTVVLGKANAEQKKIYNLVLDAQEAGIDCISSGRKCSEVFDMAMDVFENAGYGDKFIHSLGHGLGLEVHESPRISHKQNSILEKNFIVTVEPGIYIPGWGGIRIEDMVVVKDNGCFNLTHSTKKLIEV